VPRLPHQYRAARNEVWDLILESQPNYPNQSLPREKAVIIRPDCKRPSIDMLGDWLACGVLSYLIADYPMVFECAVAMQEVACQIRDDDILIVGAYCGYGLSMYCYRHDKRFTYNDLSPEAMAAYCWSLVFSDDKSLCARIHSKSARLVAAKFHELAVWQWESKYPKGWRTNLLPFERAEPIWQLARELDEATGAWFKLEEWVRTY